MESAKNAKDDTRNLPQLIENINELKKGDILLFRAPFSELESSLAGKASAMLIQAVSAIFSKQQHGHYDTTHAAMCVDDTDGVPKIAHLTGHDIMGYIVEPLDEAIKRDGGDRAFLIFRPNDPKLGDALAQEALKEEHKKLTWSIPTATKALFTVAKLDPKREITKKDHEAKESFCSQFVIQRLKDTTAENSEWQADYYPNIRSTSTPKALESWLYENANFQLLVYPGNENLYEKIKSLIAAEIARLNSNSDVQFEVKKKVIDSERKFNMITKKLDNADISNIEKTVALIKTMQALFLTNTGLGVTKPTSYKNIMDAARQRGIFERDIDKYIVRENYPQKEEKKISLS